MDVQVISGCAKRDDLARLFDRAFQVWKSGKNDEAGHHRTTPRVHVDDSAPLFLLSYTIEGNSVELGSRARILDISANGLGVLTHAPVPVGAYITVAFDSVGIEPGYGSAKVVHSTPCAQGYRIGLAFAELAEALDSAEMTEICSDSPDSRADWKSALSDIKGAFGLALNKIENRRRAVHEVERTLNGRTARFVVNARLFRYNAALFVNRRKTAFLSGALRNRAQSLFSDSALPTMIHLEAGGFSAWAVIRPNEVVHCTLDLGLEEKRRICMSALETLAKLPDPCHGVQLSA